MSTSINIDGQYLVNGVPVVSVSPTPLNSIDQNSIALIKGDDGLWREADPLNFFSLLFQSGLKGTTPNVVNHDFQAVIVTNNGSWTYLSFYNIPFMSVTGNGGSAELGKNIRIADFGNAFIRLYASPGGSSFIEIDNVVCQGITSNVYNYYNQYVLLAPNLIECSRIQYDSFLTNVSAPNLKKMGNLSSGSWTSNINFPSLEALGDLGLWTAPNSFDLPSLRYVNYLNIYGFSGGFSLPNLQVAGVIQVQNTQSTALFFPILEYVDQSFYIQNNYSLQEIDISSLKCVGSTYVTFQNNALSQQTVDNILVKFANMDGVNNGIPFVFQNASLYLNGGSNSAPSSIGLSAIQILGQRGVGVVTN